MRIRLLGQRNPLGGGTHFAGLAQALSSMSFVGRIVQEHDISAIPEYQKLLTQSDESDINIWFFGFGRAGQALPKGRNIVWGIFETNKLPEAYIQALRHADLVWVPSAWGRAILLEHDLPPEKVFVVPEGVDSLLYHPYSRAQWASTTGDPFRFLAIGKYEERKGYRQLFEAFSVHRRAFPQDELLVKADYLLNPSQLREKRSQLRRDINLLKCSGVKIIEGELDSLSMSILYNCSQAFVFASRAEGWGLPLIDALASGLPTICANHSGQSEYLRRVPGLFASVGFRTVPISDPEFQRYWPSVDGDHGSWAECDVNDLSKWMGDIRTNYHLWRAKASRASELIRREFDWKVAASIALESLVTTGLLPPASFTLQI